MRKFLAVVFVFMVIVNISLAQSPLSLISGSSQSPLGSGDIAAALKQALNNGVQKGTTQLSAANGFFANAAVKILMPPEAKKVEDRLRSMGFGQQVDDAILSMNRAAEDATKSAAPIFLNAITNMSISDALGILKGSDTAATHYLRGSTTAALTAAFMPVIKQSLEKVGATKYWNQMFTTYNRIPFVSKVNPDLTAYVTSMALSGIFYEIGLEEKNIRKNPVARTTDLLKQVFGQL